MQSNLVQRLIAGVAGSALMIGGIWYSEWSYFVFFAVISTFIQAEYLKVVGLSKDKKAQLYFHGVGILLYLLFFGTAAKLLPNAFVFVGLLFVFVPFFVELYRTQTLPFERIAKVILGLVYTILPFIALHYIAFYHVDYQPELIIGLFLLIWSNDTGAYFAGKLLGKRKLFLRISPGKTWEGAIGGLLLTVAMAWLISHYFGIINQWQWVILAAAISVMGVYGDLVESMLKRQYNIKDSGTLIPGHGGFLDRFDSFLFCTPVMIVLLSLFQLL
jgi:phosphatidate cytidylyltransferase